MSTIDWREKDSRLSPVLVQDDGEEVAVSWTPQPGSQELFLTCPVEEVLYEGTRGPGKTDALIMDFAQHTGKDQRTEDEKKSSIPQWRGWGEEWRGILFRQTYPQLLDVINKTKKWYPMLFPGAKFNEQKTTWTWETGETLRLSYGAVEADYWNYHGHAYPWIAFEELTTWASPSFYQKMFSCLRSTVPGMPRKVRATTNPYGVGHGWVKLRFNLPCPGDRIVGDIIKDTREDVREEEREPDRVAIHGYLDENKILLTADPKYKGRIRAAARNPAEVAAWMDGSWDIVAGGMFDDVWKKDEHVVLDMLDFIPSTWRIDRSFDWGSSAPFSVGWWAESDGTDLVLPNGKRYGTVRGDLFRLAEWYGWNGQPNEGLRMLATEITKGIVRREIKMGLHGRVRSGPADSAIFTVENGVSIARDMAAPVLVDGQRYRGVSWMRADKRPGSRKAGWELMRKYLKFAVRTGMPRENPGLFVCESCTQFIRTIPSLPRDMQGDPDDVDTDAEDHIADEVRYRVRYSGQRVVTGSTVGMGS